MADDEFRTPPNIRAHGVIKRELVDPTIDTSGPDLWDWLPTILFLVFIAGIFTWAAL